jgi:hypothetical protein
MDDTTAPPEPVSASRPKPRPRETRDLKIKYEIVMVDGEEGRKLHKIQSQAVLEALLWLATNRKPPDDDRDQPDRPNLRPTRHEDE